MFASKVVTLAAAVIALLFSSFTLACMKLDVLARTDDFFDTYDDPIRTVNKRLAPGVAFQ
ncbi:hypothetical protein N7528_006037 [Penicillium herquei]|nr:hypothetical protein N7528_006037 [Penicillium herquei]